MHGQEDDLDPGIELFDLPGGFQAPEVGHGDVQDDQLRLLGLEEAEKLQAVVGLSHHFQAGGLFNDALHALAEHDVVVGQHDGANVHLFPPGAQGKGEGDPGPLVFPADDLEGAALHPYPLFHGRQSQPPVRVIQGVDLGGVKAAAVVLHRKEGGGGISLYPHGDPGRLGVLADVGQDLLHDAINNRLGGGGNSRSRLSSLICQRMSLCCLANTSSIWRRAPVSPRSSRLPGLRSE